MTVITDLSAKILIHARGQMTPDEAKFWEHLRYSLNELGFDLWLISHNLPQQSMNVPLLKVPNGLDAVTDTDKQHGWSAWFPLAGDLDEEILLERERLWRGQERNQYHLERRQRALYFYKNFYTVALKLIQPVLTIIWNGHHPQEMILDQLARQGGCAVAYIERAPFAGMIHLDTQGVLGGTKIANQTTWTWSKDSDQKYWHYVMETIQNHYRQGQETWWEQPRTIGISALKKQLKIPDNFRVVLFAGQVDQDIQNILYAPLFENNLEAFRWFCQQLADQENLFILGKHHPKSKASLKDYQKIVSDTGKGVWTDQASLNDCLSLADYVAAVNSTLLYEGLMLKKPVLSMGNSLLFNKNIAYEIENLHCGDDKINEWLMAQDLPSRLERWQDFGAYLLATDFYSMMTADNEKSFGQQNAKNLAQKLSNLAISQHSLNFDQIHFDNYLSSLLEIPARYNTLKNKRRQTVSRKKENIRQKLINFSKSKLSFFFHK